MEKWGWVVGVTLATLLLVAILVVVARRWGRHRGQLRSDPAYRFQVRRKELVKNLEKATRDYRSVIQAAERNLREAEEEQSLATLSTVILTPLTAKIGRGTYPLSESTSFQLDVNGQVQTRVGRPAGDRYIGEASLGAMIIPPQQPQSPRQPQAAPEVFLTIRDAKWGELVRLPRLQPESTRRFFLAAEVALDNVESARVQKAKRIAAAEERVHAARADMTAIMQAEAALADHEERAPRSLDVFRMT